MSRYDSDAAATYDRDRWWAYETAVDRVERLVPLLRLRRDTRLLDVGCGTAYYTAMLVERSHCTAIGIDQSPEMIAIATRRPSSRTGVLQLVNSAADALPLRTHCVDAVLCHHAIHHFPKTQEFLREAKRVLRSTGVLAVVTVSHAQMKAHPIYQLFPGILDIDLRRIPDCRCLEVYLQRHGFGAIRLLTVDASMFRVPVNTLVEHVRSRFMSCMRLLTKEEFSRGCAMFEARLAASQVVSVPAESYTVLLSDANRAT